MIAIAGNQQPRSIRAGLLSEPLHFLLVNPGSIVIHSGSLQYLNCKVKSDPDLSFRSHLHGS